MKKRLKQRALLLAAAGVCLLALAVAPRPARPAKPATPARQTEEGALQGKIIFVDAGHGGTDGGARAQDSRVWEKELNLQVALALQTLLEKNGAQVIMSRETDMQYDANKRADLTARLEKATAGGAVMVISIHMNEYRSRRESGPQVFYRAGQEQSRLLAGTLQDALIRVLSPAKERVAMAGDYFMLSLPLPSVLVECGFLSNAAEEKLLLTPDYQAKVAKAVCEGICEYFALAQDTEKNAPSGN